MIEKKQLARFIKYKTTSHVANSELNYGYKPISWCLTCMQVTPFKWLNIIYNYECREGLYS